MDGLDWTTISLTGLLSAAINAAIFGFWKPWLGAYGGEKGKNLARKEDLNGILAEVRAVTIAQKEIEGRLTGNIWNRQTLWNQKRDIYGTLLNSIHKQTSALASLPAHVNAVNKALLEIDKAKHRVGLVKGMEELLVAQNEFVNAVSLAMILAPEECGKAIREYNSHKLPYDHNSAEWAIKDTAALNELSGMIIRIAKRDLDLPVAT